MKTVLLATSALVAFAGVAAAEITLDGDARLGMRYDSGLDLDDVRAHLLAQPHVLDVHDLHASQITSELPVLTAHVVIDDSCFHDGHAPRVLDQLQSCLAGHFPISVEHSTIQLEPRLHATHEHPGHH